MKTKIENKFINNFDIQLNQNQKPISCISIAPRKITKNKIGIIFLGGLNGNKATIAYFNFPVFSDKWLFTFDKRNEGYNNNPPSQKYKKHVNDTICVIDNFVKKFEEIDSWFLIGESWGSALCSLVFKNYHNSKLKGFFIWNMPCKIVDTSSKKGSKSTWDNFKVLITYIFGIPTKIQNNPPNELLTNNKILLRISKINTVNKVDSKNIIASWKSFLPAWRFLIKNHLNLNFVYVQSMEDSMRDQKQYQKLADVSSKIIFFNHGTHILAFDINESDNLFAELEIFIKLTLSNKEK